MPQVSETAENRHAVVTGPIRGTVKLKNGGVVDVRPDVLYFDSQEECQEVAHLVAKRYEKEGHPNHDPGVPFKYVPPKQATKDDE